MIKIAYRSAYFAVQTIMLVGCLKNPSIPAKTRIALQYAGQNSIELKKVILHYSTNPKDSLKLKAACFLIENMPGKGYLKFQEFNANGISSFDLFKFDIGIDSINILKKNFEDSTHCGLIYFSDPEFIEDIKTIKANDLIDDIEYSFKTREYPWCKQLSFDQFEEYILPYRLHGEPLQNWRKSFFENTDWIFKRIGDTVDRIKIAGAINDSMSRKYRYLHGSLSYFPGNLDLAQLNAARGGRCDDLNMALSYWLRALGIPAASEFTPYWANGNFGGHSWVSILDTTGKFVPMNASFDNPVRDALPFKDGRLAKAYRNVYKIQDSYYAQNETIKELPEENVKDITQEYVPVATAKIDIHPADTTEKVFLGVLNGNDWKPIPTETNRSGKEVVFENIGRNALYAPLTIVNGIVRTVGRPFVVTRKGDIEAIMEDKSTLINVCFDVSQFYYRPNLYKKRMQVYYWDNSAQDWIATGDIKTLLIDQDEVKKSKKYSPITFNNIPANAIYRIADADAAVKQFGRPFIYDHELAQFTDY